MADHADPSVSRRLAGCLGGIGHDALPSSVLTHGRALILDTLMVARAGARLADVIAATALTRDMAGRPESRIWAGGTAPAPEAAFANALAASALDFDSLHDNVHPDAIALAAAWAVAQARGRSGRDFMRAYVQGTELICRLSESAKGPQKGWTIGAVLGVFGAAAAAALLMDLGEEQTTHALGLCLSMAAGSQQANVEQVLAKRLQPALAARSGVQAALLASVGMTAPAEAFEGRFGLWSLYFPADACRLLDGWGSRWAMLGTGMKKYPVCACSHAAMDALQQALDIAQARAEDVDALEVVISPFMDRLVGGAFEPQRNPQVTAQFSLRYALSCIALRGRLGVSDLQPAAVQDQAIAQFAQRISVTVDPSNAGELAPATVRVGLRDGRRIERTLAQMPGMGASALSRQELDGKYAQCEAAGDGPGGAGYVARLRELLDTLQTVADLSRVEV